MTGKTLRFPVFCAVCLLAAAYRAPLGAVPAPLGDALAGGVSRIFPLLATSGGSTAANGSVVVTAANIGGLTDSGALLVNGNTKITTGGTPTLVTFETAKSDLSGAHCYPVPFKPSAGHTKITFKALTGSVRIRIYTISGELVRALSKADTGDELAWDVRNSRGAAVESGVYLYLIEASAKPKKGKLMIIR